MLNHNTTFWDYHTTRLTELGVGFSRLRLVKGTLQTLFEALLNPKDSVAKLLKRRYNQGWADRKFDREMRELFLGSIGQKSTEKRSSNDAAQ
jgi:hypothetical protein